MVEDVVRLMDHLHIPKAHVVGYSMGGMITMKLLTLHADRVISAVLGGMGWLQADSPMQQFWEVIRGWGNSRALVPCMNGFAQLAVTEKEVKAVRVPVTIIVGELDPCRRIYVEPLLRIRPDWPERVVPTAGHITCVMRLGFKAQLVASLDQHSGGK